MKIVQFMAIVLMATSAAFAQRQQLAIASKKFDETAYVDAIEIYERVAAKGYESKDIYEKLGDAYYFTAELGKANYWYAKLFDGEGSSLEPEYYYRYANTAKAVGDYKKGNELLEAFYDLRNNDSRAYRYQANRNYLEVIGKNSGRYDVDNLTVVNSSFSDFGAMVHNNALLFASSRTRGGLMKYIDAYTNQSFNTIYQAPYNQQGNVQGPALFSEPISDKLHASSPVFSNDGLTMYFTKSAVEKGKVKEGKKELVVLKLCKAALMDGQWADVQELPFNQQGYSMAHPALSPDNKYLYFASNMQGSIGASDLFKVEIRGQGFGEPENLGAGINTEGRETFPFIGNDGILYFASDGHPGLGGLDVFASKVEEDGNYKEVLNVGAPVNSQWDDFGFYMDVFKHEGFFTSNRDGGMGYDDIYRCYETKPIADIIDCKQRIEGIVVDKLVNDRLAKLTVVLLDEDLNEIKDAITNEEGYFSFTVECEKQYTVRVLGAGIYNPNEKILETNADNGSVASIGISLAKKRIELKEEVEVLSKVFEVHTIYFPLGEAVINDETASQLALIEAIIADYPNLNLTIIAHTDSRGSEAYNQKLSKRRAEAILEWFVGNGIERSRLKAEGRGESQLMNKCKDGVTCTEFEHKENRRIQFFFKKAP